MVRSMTVQKIVKAYKEHCEKFYNAKTHEEEVEAIDEICNYLNELKKKGEIASYYFGDEELYVLTSEGKAYMIDEKEVKEWPISNFIDDPEFDWDDTRKVAEIWLYDRDFGPCNPHYFIYQLYEIAGHYILTAVHSAHALDFADLVFDDLEDALNEIMQEENVKQRIHKIYLVDANDYEIKKLEEFAKKLDRSLA